MIIKRVLIVCLFLLLGALCSPLFAATPIMVEKDLFSQDRKPPLPQSESMSSERAGPGMAIGNIQLDGVVFRNNSRVALLRLKNIPMSAPGQEAYPVSPFVTVRVGDRVNEYRVTKIELQSVTLERSGRTYTLGLFSANRIAAPASPPPSIAAPSPYNGKPGMNQGLHNGAMFQKGFRPRNPQQALRAPMPVPPGRPPANLPPNANFRQGAPANQR